MKSTLHKTSASLTFAVSCMAALGQMAVAQQSTNAMLTNPASPSVVNFTVNDDKENLPTTFSTTFVEMGKPTGGYKCIVDMVEFGGKMYLSTADDPLGNWGAKVFSTSNATSFTSVLSDPNSQGYVRMNVFDNKLWIPDGDPNGMEPGYCYVSSTGASGSFAKTTILGAVHTFDVIKYNNKAYVSNGMGSSKGGMCEFDGSNTWNSVNQPSSSFRLKYMTQFNGKLFVANANPNSGTDYYLWTGSLTAAPQAMDKVTGPGSTYQIYATSTGKLFWTVVYSGGIHVLQSNDGISWTPSASLDGKFVSDMVELNGKLYALDWKGGLWESSDQTTFTLIAPVPSAAPDAFGPLPVPGGYNADARASMLVYNGAIYCGSSTNGKVYKVTVGTSTAVNESPVSSIQHTVTDHSVIFHLENSTSVDLRVYDLCGSLVKEMPFGTVGAGNHEIDLAELKNGFYLLQALVGNEVKGIKFVKR